MSLLVNIPAVVHEALTAFVQCEWEKFDPLVGECACHIRAAKICELADQYLHDATWQKNVQRERASLAPLSEDCLFLVQCYILTFAKELERSGYTFRETTASHLVAKQFKISKSQAQKEVKMLQVALAAASVAYVQACSSAKLKPLVGPSYVRAGPSGHSQLPCYVVAKVVRCIPRTVVLLCTQYSKGGIMQGKSALVYQKSSIKGEGHTLVLEITPEIAASVAFVIEGYSEGEESLAGGRERLKRVPLKELFLCNAARHAQYTKACAELPFSFPEQGAKQQAQFLKRFSLAETKGLCKEYADLFCVDHVYCGQVGRVLQQEVQV